MTTVNHWGKWVDSESPVTGVISNNTPEWLYEELLYNAIDLDYEAYCEEVENDDSMTEEEKQEALEYYESMGDSTLLIGNWLKDEQGKYYPDETGEYSAIMRESVTQIVWSKFTRCGALCSPCYPGQVDLDSPGEFLAYDLPPDMY